MLYTDTFVGELAAEAIASWLQACKIGSAIPHRVDGLTVRNNEEFHWGVSELVGWCEEYLEPYRQQYRILFNLVAGFKAVQGVLNTLGTFYADEMVYTFEGSQELVRIPRLPVRMDAEGVVKQHLRQIRKMALNVPVSQAEVEGIPEALLWKDRDGFTLSGWGELVWRRTWRSLYRDALLEPPIDRIRYGPHFADSVSEYAGTERMVDINHRIDDLARYLLGGMRDALKGLDPKALQGGSVGPSTHELDVWHVGDARRIFFHYDGSVAVLDRLGRALH